MSIGIILFDLSIFILGILLGTVVGLVVMALMSASSKNNYDYAKGERIDG